jgi:hypothetical protein
MATSYTRLLHEIAQIRNQMSSMIRCGTVHEIKGDKMRIYWGNDKDGQAQYSPWVHNSTVRGEATRRFAYSDKAGQSGQGGQGGESGGGGGDGGGGGGQGGGQGGGGQQNGGQQNVTVICPSGDYRQSIILPYAPQKEGSHKPPAHANKSGKGEEPWQMGANRYNRSKDSYDWWFEDDNQQGGGSGGGGGDSGGQGGGDQYQSGPGDQRLFSNKKAGLGGQHTKGKSDFMATAEGVGIRQEEQHVSVSKEDQQVIVKSTKPPIVNQPWEIKDKKSPIKKYEGSSGGGGGGGGS